MDHFGLKTYKWINSFKQQKHLKRINPPILEKMIHALSLLQQLKAHGLDFTFKGGTSLVLLLAKSRRFSLDIDIITTQSREEVEAILDKVVTNSHFNKWDLQDRRSYKECGAAGIRTLVQTKHLKAFYMLSLFFDFRHLEGVQATR